MNYTKPTIAVVGAASLIIQNTGTGDKGLQPVDNLAGATLRCGVEETDE